jgi:hypothetical protein
MQLAITAVALPIKQLQSPSSKKQGAPSLRSFIAQRWESKMHPLRIPIPQICHPERSEGPTIFRFSGSPVIFMTPGINPYPNATKVVSPSSKTPVG